MKVSIELSPEYSEPYAIIYADTCITLISSLSAYQSPPDTSHAYLKIAVAQICLHHKIRYCTIKSLFSILTKSSLFFQFIGINL